MNAKTLFPNGGYFVEAGAHDGVGDSQTYELEKLGWKGLCAEPSSAFAGLQRNRKCSVDSRALAGTDGRLLFREVSGSAVELSGLLHSFYDHWDRETRPHADRAVECVTLNRMLREHGAPSVIEYLSLDTEGSELEILRAHSFDEYLFLYVCVEYNNVEERATALCKLLAPDYNMKLADGTNLHFLHWSYRGTSDR